MAKETRRARRAVRRDGERGQRSEVRRRRSEDKIADFKKTGDKDSTVGAAFQPRSCDLNDFNEFNDFNGLNDFNDLTNRLIL